MPDNNNASSDATTINRVEVSSLDDLLGTPGADNILTASGEGKKPNFFGKEKVDVSFIDKPEKKVDPAPAAETAEAKEARLKLEEEAAKNANKGTPGKGVEELNEVLNEIQVEGQGTPAGDDKLTAGRPKIDKEGIVELTKKFIEKGIMVPFEGDKPVDEYTLKDFEELFEANIQDRENKIKEETPLQFFDSLPTELQVAAKYHADGGKDLKGLFRALSQVEETRALDPSKETDQEAIVREYLRATNFGTEEDIQEEVVGWKDMNKLGEKATKFKPKLDQMREEQIAYKLAQQEGARKQQAEAAQNYMSSVYETLKPGELAGLKLDKKTQSLLYNGLVAPNYPSISGRQTNLLGHLLEKYQYVEPNHGLIAEALWLLSDPDAYRNKVREGGKQEQVIDTVKKLKTEEASKKGTGIIQEENQQKKRTIPRHDNFFKINK